MLGAGGFSTFLFLMGLITLASSGLQLVSYSKAAQDVGLKALSTNRQHISTSSLSPAAIIWFTICAASVSIVVGLVFTVLDLVGMIVLRSRMWQHIARINSGMDGMGDGKMYMWDTYANNSSGGGSGYRGADIGGEWWSSHMGGKGHGFDMDTRRSLVRWWQQWVFLEELVFSIQRNIATIRLAISIFLALVWSSSLIQLIVIAVAGKCHIEGNDVRPSNSDTENVCVLLRHGMVGSVISWACWGLISIVLIFVNTRSQRLRSRLNLPHSFAGAPLPGLDFGIGPIISSGPAQGGKNFSMPRSLNQMHSACFQQQQQQQGWHPSISLPIPTTTPMQMSMSMPAQAQTRAPSQIAGHHRKPGKSHFRTSWSQLDDESIMTDSRSEGHSILDNKSHMLFQLYHLQNQQFQSLHQFQHPSKISEEKVTQQMGPKTTGRNSFLGDPYVNEAILEDARLQGARQNYMLQQQQKESGGEQQGSQSLASFGGSRGKSKISSKRRTIG
ncbi:hypothetical protein FB645_000043 [Coemansia sp. IMI 203386]|nr:hypothetical protein FB645_000043 [Coemansia sp. IMI 203386]